MVPLDFVVPFCSVLTIGGAVYYIALMLEIATPNHRITMTILGLAIAVLDGFAALLMVASVPCAWAEYRAQNVVLITLILRIVNFFAVIPLLTTIKPPIVNEMTASRTIAREVAIIVLWGYINHWIRLHLSPANETDLNTPLFDRGKETETAKAKRLAKLREKRQDSFSS